MLRDGQYIGTEDVADITKDKLINMMVGRELKNLFPKENFERGEIGFEVKNLTVYDAVEKNRRLVDHVSFCARYGEILGIAGLVGAGRTEMIQGLIGHFPERPRGRYILIRKR